MVKGADGLRNGPKGICACPLVQGWLCAKRQKPGGEAFDLEESALMFWLDESVIGGG